jgi:DNA-binding GntR family transcriptional regulator
MLRTGCRLSITIREARVRSRQAPPRHRHGPRQPAKSGRLSDTAYAEIRRRIIELALRPGSTISEPELSAALGYTKASVRVALLRLSQENLVRPVARQGYVVSPLTIQDARNIFDLRLLLEPRAAHQAAGKLTLDDFREIEPFFVAGYDPDQPETFSGFLAANKEFRLIVPRATGNERLVSIISVLLDELERYLRLSYLATPNRSPVFLTGHRTLVKALIDGAADEAETIMRDQLEVTREAVLQALLSRQEILGKPLEAA